MSMDGDCVGFTPAGRYSPVAKARARMSFSLVATISRSTGSPMRLANQPASTSPKLPVGTAKLILRCGAPKETAEVR